LLPFFFLESFLCSFFNLFSSLDKYFGLSIISASEVIANSLSPKSIPTMFLLFWNFIISTSVQQIDIKYLPEQVLVMVQFMILPCISLDLANLTHLSFGSFI